MNFKPIVTEKAVMAIESQNALIFETEKINNKTEIKNEIENLFKVKVDRLSTQIRGNKKYVRVKLKKEFPAIDLATKLGII
ncbi:50S ribosomal protein L23 [Candidatus Pacearchaeota archaeon]|jgi:large subunit ribosomal protein L23|nr:50S ribosomal protein L23 [Candidatus Pacearchaeota archaeon]